MLKPLLNLLFPKICYACGNSINSKIEHICISCRNDLARVNTNQKKENPIEKIFRGRLELEEATSYLKFEKNNKTQKLLHALKYQGIKELGVSLGEIAALEIEGTSFFNEIDLLIPIPIHPKKKKKRGYNQSEFIAEGVSNITQLPIDILSVKKSTNTSSQTKKSRFQRFENVSETFTIENKDQLANKHILLIDDVVTTGATIESCGNMLKNIEGVRLSLLTIACTY